MILAIDFGTTSSLAAYYKDGDIHILPLETTSPIIPTAISMDEGGEIYIGTKALEQLGTVPVHALFKGGLGTSQTYMLSGKAYLAWELAALFFKKIREKCNALTGLDFSEVILDYPPFASVAMQKDLLRAARRAGFGRGYLLSHTTAAALSYGLEEEKPGTRFLVFHVGGYGFDVSLLERMRNNMHIIPLVLEERAGGEAFTRALVVYALDQWQIQEATVPPAEMENLRLAAGRCKKRLTWEKEALLQWESEGRLYQCHLTRELLENVGRPWLEQWKSGIQDSFYAHALHMEDIEEGLLVGGASIMPMIRHFSTELLKEEPRISANPEETIVQGLAIQAGRIRMEQEVREDIQGHQIIEDVPGEKKHLHFKDLWEEIKKEPYGE